MKALFVCLTPFQMKLSMSLVKSKGITDFGIIAIFLSDNEKYNYYYNELKSKSKFSFKYCAEDKAQGYRLLLDVLKYKFKLFGQLRNINIESLYVASIDNRYVQVVASCFFKADIYTFDDGLANLNYSGKYYAVEKLTLFKKIIWNTIGVCFFAQDFRLNSKTHFSIYRNKRNIIKNVEFISFLNDGGDQLQGRSGTVSFFVGQPLYEINKEMDASYVNNLILKMNIDHYYPHPREDYVLNGEVNIVQSNRIFEDYIFDYYIVNPVEKIRIFTVCSTVVLNLTDYSFIESFIIYDHSKIDEKIIQLFDPFDVKVLSVVV